MVLGIGSWHPSGLIEGKCHRSSMKLVDSRIIAPKNHTHLCDHGSPRWGKFKSPAKTQRLLIPAGGATVRFRPLLASNI